MFCQGVTQYSAMGPLNCEYGAFVPAHFEEEEMNIIQMTRIVNRLGRDASRRGRVLRHAKSIAMVACFFAGAAAPVAFGSDYDASVFENFFGFKTELAADSGLIDAAASATWNRGPTAQASGDAYATSGILTGSTSLSAAGNGAPTQSPIIGGGVEAIMVIDDIILSGPATEVATALNVEFEGTVVSGGTEAMPRVGMFRRFSVNLWGQNAAGTPVATGPTSQSFQNTSGATFSILKTATRTFATNQPLTAEITYLADGSARAGTEIGGSPIHTAFVQADFSNKVYFAESIPVFDLPPGFTARSVSAGIADNHFVVVPEPEGPVKMMISPALTEASTPTRTCFFRLPLPK